MTHPLHILADRVEGLSGPDASVDRDIRDALGLPNDYGADWGSRGNDVPAAFPYTASLDSAASLIPEVNGRRPQVEYIGPNPNNSLQGHRVWLWCKGLSNVPRGRSATSAARAITAASLRAIAANQENPSS